MGTISGKEGPSARGLAEQFVDRCSATVVGYINFDPKPLG